MFRERGEIVYNGTHSTNQPHTSYYSNLALYFFPFCRILYLVAADGLLGDTHDAAGGTVFQGHLVEDEEEGFSLMFACVSKILSSH